MSGSCTKGGPTLQRRILAVIGAIALMLPSTAALAATGEESSSPKSSSAGTRGEISEGNTPRSVDADGRVTVIIEMKGDPVAVVQAEKGRKLTASERSAVKGKLKKAQDSIRGSITGKGGKIQAQMQSAYNGIQAVVPATQLDAVADLPGVVAVHPVRTYELDNAVSVPFLGVPQVWEDTGYTGANVKVAILDTGVDYTHAAFGGPGTVEAFQAAAATSDEPADPALFGPAAPRVKGGIDLVGDDYNADPASETYQPVPHPDPNPLDCNGHGSHVAGTAAGSGVNDDGSTYTGPYDSTTASQTFRVGPGVAPEADIYAVRVFGCDGSTDVVVPAIDWAVANGMDVINMSLGSSFGRGDDPDAVAASNAVGAGVVVVASAGNSGPSPYLTGSPGTGDGVIAVSAVDSSETFPGATITVDGTDVEAINANGASLEGLGSLEVVRVTDDPATANVNEALGCSAASFTQAGVVPGGSQLAVVERGTCARVAKAIFGEQAGAAAVVMVNSDDSLPPYEGRITSNPDDNTPFVVTIPFLGVRLSDGAAFVDGATATLAAAEIANPNFRGYASFSSSGPRSGDGAISPDVAAPGVSIASAGVGTGSEAAIISGTSMASPHVAGVAALTVQSHPSWTAPQVAAAIVSTADPDKVAGQSLTRGGVGLVDTAQAVATTVTATGDAFRTDSGWAREAALSYGVQESSLGFGGVKTVTIRNDGKKPVTFTVSSAPTAQSIKANVKFSQKKITVRAGGTAKLVVSVSASAKDVPTSLLPDDQFAFYEISGDVVLTSSDATLTVPYLVVPRSTSKVSATVSASPSKHGSASTASKGKDHGKGKGKGEGDSSTKKLTLRNTLGALNAQASVYQWGLNDKKDAPKSVADTGYDLRAAGVRTYMEGSEQVLEFAVNTHRRWSNGANNEFDVVIDVNRDGTPDWIVFSYDSGALRAGSVDGVTEVFLYRIATRQTFAAGYLATAPTDSSTILLPVWASDIGVTGAFDYSVAGYSLTSGGEDEIAGVATYDPNAPAYSSVDDLTVPKRGKVSASFTVDKAAKTAQKPLGQMVVVFDNQSGAKEALLLKVK